MSSERTAIKPSPRRRCPVNGQEYPRVGVETIKQHLQKPWLYDLEEHSHYSCDDPFCYVTYFNDVDELVKTDQLRERPGLKSQNPSDTLCFCFGVSMAESNNKSVQAYIVKQTKEQACACRIRNPFGRCCLKDFPK